MTSRRSCSRSGEKRPTMANSLICFSSAPRAIGAQQQAMLRINAAKNKIGLRCIARQPLSRLEQAVLHQLMEQGTDAAALFVGAAHHVVQRLAISEGDVAAGGVDCQLLREVAQECVRIGGEHGFKLADAAEL